MGRYINGTPKGTLLLITIQ